MKTIIAEDLKFTEDEIAPLRREAMRRNVSLSKMVKDLLLEKSRLIIESDQMPKRG